MIWHRQDSVQALQEEERLTEQKARLAEQSVEAARVFAARTETLSDGDALAMPDLFPVWEDVLAAGEKLTEGTVLRDGRRSTASCRRAVWYRRNTSRRTRRGCSPCTVRSSSRTRGPRTIPFRGSTGWTAMPGSISAMKATCTASRRAGI